MRQTQDLKKTSANYKLLYYGMTNILKSGHYNLPYLPYKVLGNMHINDIVLKICAIKIRNFGNFQHTGLDLMRV